MLVDSSSALRKAYLEAVGIEGTDTSPITSDQGAFDRGQHLMEQMMALSRLPGFHDAVALTVDAVKNACYSGADLVPEIGGALHVGGTIPARRVAEPAAAALERLGRLCGEALRRVCIQGLVDPITETKAAFARGRTLI
jgi:hypothetical protein